MAMMMVGAILVDGCVGVFCPPPANNSRLVDKADVAMIRMPLSPFIISSEQYAIDAILGGSVGDQQPN